MRRIILLVTFLGIPGIASAQSYQGVQAENDVQLESSTDANIRLEMRWFVVNGDLMARIATPQLAELPQMGSLAVLDREQVELFAVVAEADMRSSVRRTQTVRLSNGSTHTLSRLTVCPEDQGNDAIQATILADQQAIEIRWTWAKRKRDQEPLPVKTSVVPIGKFLVVHTRDVITVSSAPARSTSFWGELADRLSIRKPKPVARTANVHVFLVVTPQFVPRE